MLACSCAFLQTGLTDMSKEAERPDCEWTPDCVSEKHEAIRDIANKYAKPTSRINTEQNGALAN